MSPTTSRAWSIAWALVSCGLVGCSGPRVEAPFVRVEGRVTIQQQPVKRGAVSFVSLDGFQVYSGTILDGRYQLSAGHQRLGALPGLYRVAIRGGSSIITLNDDGQLTSVGDAVAAKYQSAQESGLIVHVGPQGGPVDIDLAAAPTSVRR